MHNSFVLTRTCKNRECLLYNMPHILCSFTALWDSTKLRAGYPGYLLVSVGFECSATV